MTSIAAPDLAEFDLAVASVVLDVCLKQAGIAFWPSQAFVVVDPAMLDSPVIHVSPAFETLTGYPRHEILGRNCRFLQSPDGLVEPGSSRQYVNDGSVHEFKLKLARGGICQHPIANFNKYGIMFTNWVTVVPIPWGYMPARFLFGFSINLSDSASTCTSPLDFHVRTKPEMEQRRHSRQIHHASPSLPLLSGTASLPENAQALLDHFDALFLVLSRRGRILYASSSSATYLGFDPGELYATSISAISHPADATLVLRELRDAILVPPSASATEPPAMPTIDLMHRLQHRSGGFAWFHSLGTSWADRAKLKDYKILLSCRHAPVASLSRSLVTTHGGALGSHSFWARLAASGAVLAVLSRVPVVLAMSPELLVGTTFQNMIQQHNAGDADTQRFTDMLASTTREALVATSTFKLKTPANWSLEASITIYPAECFQRPHCTSPSVLLQGRVVRAYPAQPATASRIKYPSSATYRYQRARELPMARAIHKRHYSLTTLDHGTESLSPPNGPPSPSTSSLSPSSSSPPSSSPSSSGPSMLPADSATKLTAATRGPILHSATADDYAQEDDILAGLSALSLRMPCPRCAESDDGTGIDRDQPVGTRGLESTAGTKDNGQQADSGKMRYINNLEIDSQIRGIQAEQASVDEDEDEDKNQEDVSSKDNNDFSRNIHNINNIHDDGGFAVWPLQLHRLQAENIKLQADLELLERAHRTRKRIRSMGGTFHGCVNCHAKESPEWRRGPSGARDLCNRCGLRYAKEQRQLLNADSGRSGDKNSGKDIS